VSRSEASAPWAVAVGWQRQQPLPRLQPSRHDPAGVAWHVCWMLASQRRHGVPPVLCRVEASSEALEPIVRHELTLGARFARRQVRPRTQAGWLRCHPSAKIQANLEETVSAP